MTFAGSPIARGRAKGVVVATGASTNVGQLALDVMGSGGGQSGPGDQPKGVLMMENEVPSDISLSDIKILQRIKNDIELRGYSDAIV